MATSNPNTQRVFPTVSSLHGNYNATNISTATTTVIASTGVLFHGITINNVGATATITIYDNGAASGTKIATIGGTLVIGTLEYDIETTTGLTIVTSGGTAPDITVSYL